MFQIVGEYSFRMLVIGEVLGTESNRVVMVKEETNNINKCIEIYLVDTHDGVWITFCL